MYVDEIGDVFVTGLTGSNDFPTTPNAYDRTLSGYSDVFVTKLSADFESLVYSTLIGGDGFDVAYGLTVDGQGRALITGNTHSTDYPTTSGAYQTQIHRSDVFITMLNPYGNGIARSTLVTGSGQNRETSEGHRLACDTNGNVYVLGVTGHPNFPTTSGAFCETFNDGYDLFVLKLKPDFSDLLYSTFIGGSGHDHDVWNQDRIGFHLASDGGVYFATFTGSEDFPVPDGAYCSTLNNGNDAIVGKLNAAGSNLVFATYLGGNRTDQFTDIAVSGDGAIYLVGITNSEDFPVTPNAWNSSFMGDDDSFIVRFNSNCSQLQFSSYLGGNSWDWLNSIHLDDEGCLFVSGNVASNDFPTTKNTYKPNDPTPYSITGGILARLDPRLPRLTELSGPTNVTTGDEFSFSAWASDNLRVGRVYVETWSSGSETVFESDLMLVYGNKITGGRWQGKVTAPSYSLADLSYRFSARDTSGNIRQSRVFTATVTDNDGPELQNMTPGMINLGETLRFKVKAEDNIGVQDGCEGCLLVRRRCSERHQRLHDR